MGVEGVSTSGFPAFKVAVKIECQIEARKIGGEICRSGSRQVMHRAASTASISQASLPGGYKKQPTCNRLHAKGKSM
jgi:hypothetical protein